MLLEDALAQHLVSDGGVAGLVAGRVYRVQMRSGDPLPAIICTKISAVPSEFCHDGPGGVESRMQISCLGRTYAETKTLASKVKKSFAALEQAPGYLGGASGLFVSGVYRETEGDLFEANDVEQESRHHVPIDYLFEHALEDF